MHSQQPLRAFQKKALEILQKNKPMHLICVAPTGSGKSRIFETHAAKPTRKTVLISPLVALARQQADNFRALGVQTYLIAGQGGGSEFRNLDPKKGGVAIISPEQSDSEHLARWSPDLLVVDECHCVWDWGDRFRPSFARLPKLPARLTILQSIWLTATLPPNAHSKIWEELPSPKQLIGNFDLPKHLELQSQKVDWPNRPAALYEWMESTHGEPGIVFVNTRAETQRVSRLLCAMNIPSLIYHAGMSHEERLISEKKIKAQNNLVVIATSAFGMGMNFTQLQWTLLWQAPPSPLALAQAIGRAGRAHQSARAKILWDLEDFSLLEWMVSHSVERQQDLKSVWNLLNSPADLRVGLKKFFETPRP